MSRPEFKIDPAHAPELGDLGLDRLEACLDYDRGEVVKAEIPGRDVVRIDRDRGSYYLKRVRGKGWKDVPHENAVLERLRLSGLPVPEPVAFGSRGNEAALVTVGLPTENTLEQLLLRGEVPPERLRNLLDSVAGLLRDLHGLGVNHRDFYAGHIHLGEADRVYLVDLGRAEVRGRVPRRRVIKDLAALNFSIPERVVGPKARLRFLLDYLGGSASRNQIRRIARQVDRKSQRMRRHSLHKLERGEANVHVNE